MSLAHRKKSRSPSLALFLAHYHLSLSLSLRGLKPIRPTENESKLVSDSRTSATSFQAIGFNSDNLSAITFHTMFFFCLTKLTDFQISIFLLYAVQKTKNPAVNWAWHVPCAIGFKHRRYSIYRKVTTAMHPRTCMQVLGCIATVTAAGKF